MGHHIRQYYESIYEGNDEFDGLVEERTLHEMLITSNDLVLSNLSRCSEGALEYVKASTVENYLLGICSFMLTEK